MGPVHTSRGSARRSDGRAPWAPFARRLPAARAAVAAGFMLSGIAFASWVVRIPDMQQRLALSESRLGLVLLGVALGGLIAMPLSGALIARFGSRPVALGATLCLAASVSLPPLMPGALSLALVLVVLGAANSVMAVALNTQAAAVERRMRRPIMAGLHALYSLGGLVGAAAGGLAAGRGVAPGAHLAAAGVFIGGAALLVAPRLIRPHMDGAAGGPAFARPTRPLLLLGLVAFCVLLGEGAVADWSTVYMRDVTRAGPGLAAAGFAAFSLMMAAGRFAGDALTLRLGPALVVRGGAVSAAAGIALAAGQSHPWTAVVGFGLVGAGLSTIFPAVLTATGRVQGTSPSSAIAAVSSIGYMGFLAGPPLIGFVAEAISLRGGIAVVGVASVLIVALGGIFPGPAPAPRRRSRASLPSGTLSKA